jgi:plasmid stability protein
MVQIRNVPEGLHRQLKARAAALGMTLSDYLLSELTQIADTPPLPEFLAKWDRDVPRTTRSDATAADIVRELRGPLGAD